ncbi:MAG: hypothetical protein R2942_12410 [Ignavibacteria bacterium]
MHTIKINIINFYTIGSQQFKIGDKSSGVVILSFLPVDKTVRIVTSFPSTPQSQHLWENQKSIE